MARYPLDLPPGVFGDDTTLADQGRWAACDKVRFRLGRPQVDGGWESLTDTLLTGVCRAVLPFRDNAGLLNIAFGTHSALQIWQSGSLADITPYGPPTRLANNPLTVTNGSPVVTVSHLLHGRSTGDQVKLAGALQTGRLTINGGPYSITVVDANTYTVNVGTNATVTKTLGANPLSVLNGSNTVTVTETNHNIADGTSVAFAGSTAVGGITPNGTFAISVIDANSYSFQFTSPATSTATGGGSAVTAAVPTTGGGANVVDTPQIALPAGQVDGTGSIGWGTGAYGGGPWGQNPQTLDYVLRTWSLGAWGQTLLGSPRNGGLYQWSNVLANRAVVVDGAPAQIAYMLVAPINGGYMCFALGTQEEASGVFNPMCVRHCSIRKLNEWNTDTDTTAREYILEGGGRIIAGRMIGPYMLVWTDDSLFLGTYIGSLDAPWRFERVDRHCGLIGPNAAVVVGQTAFWIAPDRQVFSYVLGGAPQPVPCPIRTEFSENLSASQGDKIVASSNAEFSEIRFDYPDQRDGHENSRFIRMVVNGTDAGAWSQGIQARTFFVDAGPSLYPLGVTYDGHVYYHEKGQTADGQAFSWFIRSADQLIDNNTRMLVRGVWPDFKEQVGQITPTLRAREYPQGTVTTVSATPMSPNDQKADVLVTGRYFGVEFAGNSVPTAARIGTPVFDVVSAGKL